MVETPAGVLFFFQLEEGVAGGKVVMG